MQKRQLIESLIERAQRILISPNYSDEIFKKWYSHAEGLLEKVFGVDWHEYIYWDGYKRGESYSDDRERLKNAIENVKQVLLLIDGNQVEKIANSYATKKNPFSIADIDLIKSFIVHGSNDKLKLELKNFLQNILKLPEPIILHEKPSFGHTIIEKFEQYASEITLAFILLTPDDLVAQIGDSPNKLYRARQNVIFELGFFYGILGRKNGKVILLYQRELDIPSDISGIIYIDVSNGIEAAGELIRKELGFN